MTRNTTSKTGVRQTPNLEELFLEDKTKVNGKFTSENLCCNHLSQFSDLLPAQPVTSHTYPSCVHTALLHTEGFL